MALLRADRLDPGTELQTDICIAGAGAAGIALASELDGGPFAVCLLEGGEEYPSPVGAELDEMEVVGRPLNRTRTLRLRCFGGTTRESYGRCVLFDALDLEQRSWVDYSGWPIGESDLYPFYTDAARLLRMPMLEAMQPMFWQEHLVWKQFSGGGLKPGVNLWARNIDMGKAFLPQLRRSDNVTVVLGGNVTGCLAGTNRERVERMEVHALNGNRLSVRARVFVLACGGLETPRILLLSQRAEATAPAVTSEAVGRYYMDHPRTEGVAHLKLDPGCAGRRKLEQGLVMHRSRRARGRIQFMLGLDEQTQRNERLLNSCGFFYAVSDDSAKRMRRALSGLADRRGASTLRHAGYLLGHLPTAISGAAHHAASRPFRVDHLVFVDQSEQTPDPESRVSLSDRLDRFGKPRIRLDWRIGAQTTDTLRRLHELIATRVEELGIGALHSELLKDSGYQPDYGDCAHPMGTTRMTGSPSTGVTDPDCLVHGTHNLYVAGNSLIPAGGYANPTFTVVALAVRLARHIGRTLAPPVA